MSYLIISYNTQKKIILLNIYVVDCTVAFVESFLVIGSRAFRCYLPLPGGQRSTTNLFIMILFYLTISRQGPKFYNRSVVKYNIVWKCGVSYLLLLMKLLI